MTRLVRFSNNAVSKLASAITASSTTITLQTGDGSKFPTLTGTQYFMATLVKADGTTEVVKVTARSGDTLTVQRAAEAVAGVQTSYSFSSGDRIEHRLTAGAVASELDRLDQAAYINPLNKSSNYTVTAADVTSLIRVNTGSGNVTITLPDISTLTDDFDVIVTKVTGDTNTVAIARSGTDTINGATSQTLTNQWQSAWLTADRSTGTWTVISSGSGGVKANVDTFTGSGTAGPFTLSGDPGVKENTAVYVGGVYQQKSTYTLSGTSLTLGGTVSAGVPIEVIWAQPLQVGYTAANQVTASDGASGSLFTTVQGFLDSGFKQSGTGAVARKPLNKLLETVSVKDFGAVGDGVTNDAAAIQATSDYLASVGGGQIYIPDGTFFLSTAVSLGNNITLVGNGPTSIIKGGVSSFITATSKSNIEIRNVKFLNDNYRVFFDSCTNVRLMDCYGDGTRASTNVTNQGFWFRACDDVLIENPYFVDYRDAIYFDKNGATPCGTATVRGGQIWQSKHGSLINYPTGVYGVDVKKLYVDGTIFKNIKASSDSTAGGTGYGVYEGDGTDGNLEIVKVTNCKFIDDDGYATRPMIGVLISVAQIGMVDSCYFKGPSGGSYVGFIYGAREQTIQNCVFDAAACQPDRLTGTPKTYLIANNLFKNIAGRVLRICPNTPAVQTVTITGNTFRDCTYGPITVVGAGYVHATDNTITECNTSGQTSDSYRAGINLDGPTAGLISGNLILNGSAGLAQYGVNVANSTNTVFTSGNRYVGMTVSDIRNANSGDYSIGTFTPTIIGSSTAGTASYTQQLGKYTKIGRMVTCQIRLNWTGGTGTGSLKVAGLPFISANDSIYGTMHYGWFGDVSLTASNVATGYVDLGATTLNVYQYPVGGGAISAVPYDAAGNMNFTVTYMTA